MKYSFFFDKPSSDLSLILMALHQDSRRVTISTELSDCPACWDRRSKTVIKSPTATFTNEMLSRWKSAADWVNSRPEYVDMTLDDKKQLVLERMGKGRRAVAGSLLLPYYYSWATTTTTQRRASRQMLYGYKKLKEYVGSRQLTFDDVSVAFCESYIEWLSRNGIGENTRGTHIKNLKCVMRDAEIRGMHHNQAYRNFRRERAEVDTVYLTTSDLERLEQVRVCGMKEMARDLFLIGCHTAMRYSDYSRLTYLDAQGDYLYQIQQKTKERVILPMHPKVKHILEKWNGSPKIPLPEFNRLIKIVCREAGIVQTVTVLKDNRPVKCEKWELVSSHTARRTAATNMYKAGIPSISIMKITGHRTESNFLKYIRLSKEENAAELAKHPFFRE